MSAPLQRPFDNHRTLSSAIKVVRRLLDHRSNPLANTDFYALRPDECRLLLDEAERELNTLTSLAIFAEFERILRDQLVQTAAALKAGFSAPPQLGAKFHALIEERVDKRWPVDDLIPLFEPPVSKNEVANAQQIKTYRNAVAHGKRPSNALAPKFVKQRLLAFLKAAGLV